jgi:hypothetical protein
MTYNYIVSTGDSTISGSVLNILDNNQISYSRQQYEKDIYVIRDEDGEEKENPFYFDDSIITGSNCSLLSLNSQTLLEGGFSITTGANKYYYNINDSGNYVVDGENSKGNIIFDPVLTLGYQDFILYDKRDFATGILIYFTSSFDFIAIEALKSKVDSAYSNASTAGLLFDNYDVFLNGQKLKLYEYPNSTVTGNLFAIPKKDGIIEVHSDEPDLFGSGFVEHHVNLYLNGMEQDNQDHLQLYTGVYMIETGVNSSFTLVGEETETYVL